MSGTFKIFLYSCFFRSANCQAISTEANTTQECHVWKPWKHQGYDWRIEGIEMLQGNSNLSCSFLTRSPLSMPTLCSVGGVCSWCRCTSSRSVSVVCLDYKVCTWHHLSNVCMWVPLYFAVCVGCADTPQGVIGGSGTVWEQRCVVSSTWCVEFSSVCIVQSRYSVKCRVQLQKKKVYQQWKDKFQPFMTTCWYPQFVNSFGNLLFTRSLCTSPDTTTKESYNFTISIHQHVCSMFCGFIAFHFQWFYHMCTLCTACVEPGRKEES